MTNLFPVISLQSIFQAKVNMGKLLPVSQGEGEQGDRDRQLCAYVYYNNFLKRINGRGAGMIVKTPVPLR